VNEAALLEAQRTLRALLTAELELVATLDHPEETGTAFNQVLQLLGQLDRELHANTF
jgi:hypothetical protein